MRGAAGGEFPPVAFTAAGAERRGACARGRRSRGASARLAPSGRVPSWGRWPVVAFGRPAAAAQAVEGACGRLSGVSARNGRPRLLAFAAAVNPRQAAHGRTSPSSCRRKCRYAGQAGPGAVAERPVRVLPSWQQAMREEG